MTVSIIGGLLTGPQSAELTCAACGSRDFLYTNGADRLTHDGVRQHAGAAGWICTDDGDFCPDESTATVTSFGHREAPPDALDPS